MAPLIAALLGIHWPTNSVGVLPDLDPTRPGYLLPRGGDETKAKSALVNAKVSDLPQWSEIVVDHMLR